MAISYKLMKCSVTGNVLKQLQKTDDDGKLSFIPKDEGNTDYQEYLEWAKTNTAEAAD